MVALLGFLQHHEILVKHLLLREGDTVDTCHLLALGIATPEGSGNTRYLDSLDKTGRYKVRATAKVGKGTLCICRDCAVLKVLVNVLTLVELSVGIELCQRVGLRHVLAHYRLILLGQFHHLCLYLGEVIL